MSPRATSAGSWSTATSASGASSGASTRPTRRTCSTPGRPRTTGRSTHDLWRAIEQLPAKQRAVIALRYYEDMSEAEIARTLGVSVGTIKSQASKAMAKLRATVPRDTDSPSEEV